MSKSKIFIIIIIGIISILILTGCNKQEQEGTIQTSQENTEKFSVEYNGVQVVPGTEFNAETIGEEAEFSEIPSCAFAGTDKVYTYAGMEITVATIDSKDKVYSVYFIDDSVETEEGVKITDSKEKMIEKYGENYEISLETKYTYTRGDVELSFIIENDMITSIEYTLKTDNA